MAATCKDHYAPTFWSTKRLASVTTQVRKDGMPVSVDHWTPEQQYPRPGDGEPFAALWLRSIVHTGNTLRCFPVTWARPGHADRTDWFHKYVVETVTISDRISSSTE